MWGNEYLSNIEKPAYFNQFSYDANGNILSQYRTNATGNGIDSLIYNYAHDSNNELFQNRLYSVNDKVAANKFSDDIDDQGTFDTILERVNADNNYSYDEIGQLKKDSAEQIQSITWTVYNKIKSINRYAGSTKQNLSFDYDAATNRVAKHVYTSAGVWQKSIYYVRDAQGNIMSTYERKNVGTAHSFRIKEHDIYGSNRMGTAIDSLQLIGTNPDTVNYIRVLGQKTYEMDNHLGNVITVINDRKIAQASAEALTIYNSPTEARIGIDSLGGMKIQPLVQNGGNIFAVKTMIGQSYKTDFYVNLAKTQSGDGLSFDYPSSTGNSLTATGHYTFNFTATDTLSNLVAYYSSTGNTPNDYFMFDSLNVINTGITNDTIRGYLSAIANVSDYNPFGSVMNGRQYAANGQYRNGFNGQEKDDEISGAGNMMTAEYWEYDTRLGRRWNLDPKPTTGISDYACFNNNPIFWADPNGDKVKNGYEEDLQTAKENKADKKQAYDNAKGINKLFKGISYAIAKSNLNTVQRNFNVTEDFIADYKKNNPDDFKNLDENLFNEKKEVVDVSVKLTHNITSTLPSSVSPPEGELKGYTEMGYKGSNGKVIPFSNKGDNVVEIKVSISGGSLRKIFGHEAGHTWFQVTHATQYRAFQNNHPDTKKQGGHGKSEYKGTGMMDEDPSGKSAEEWYKRTK
jgi:RHS repeat-associated protein